MPVDIYGKGAKVEDKNPALTKALNEAVDKYVASWVEMPNSDGIAMGYPSLDQRELVQEAYTKAGLDPKTVPKTVDLGAWQHISTFYNGAGGDPQRMIELTVPYEDGRTKNEAGARDAIAMGIANGWDDAKITGYKDQYNADHSGKEGWFYENLGIKGSDLAKVAVIAAGGWALAPAAGAAATGAAATGAGATTAASGLAGTLGMTAGYGATALNAGALNAGITLARGGNIGDALKSGVTAAALSGVGGWAKDAIGGATVELGKGISSAVSNVGAGALTGAVGAAVTGRDWKEGLTTGAISGGISAASSAVGGWAKESTAELGKTVSSLAGNAAATATNTVLRGGDVGTAAQNVAINAAGGATGSYAKETTGSDFAGQTAATLTSTALRGGNLGKATENLALNYAMDKGDGIINSLMDKKPNAVFKNAGVANPLDRVYAGLSN